MKLSLRRSVVLLLLCSLLMDSTRSIALALTAPPIETFSCDPTEVFAEQAINLPIIFDLLHAFSRWKSAYVVASVSQRIRRSLGQAKVDLAHHFGHARNQLRRYWRQRGKPSEGPPEKKSDPLLSVISSDPLMAFLAPFYMIPAVEAVVDFLNRALHYDEKATFHFHPIFLPGVSLLVILGVLTLLTYNPSDSQTRLGTALWILFTSLKYMLAPYRRHKTARSWAVLASYELVLGLFVFYPILRSPNEPWDIYLIPVLLRFVFSFLIALTIVKTIPAAPEKEKIHDFMDLIKPPRPFLYPPKPLGTGIPPSNIQRLTNATVSLSAKFEIGNMSHRSFAVASVIGHDKRYVYLLTNHSITSGKNLAVSVAYIPSLQKFKVIRPKVIHSDAEKDLALLRIDQLEIPSQVTLETGMLAPPESGYTPSQNGALVPSLPHWSPEEKKHNQKLMNPLERLNVPAGAADVFLLSAGSGGAFITTPSGLVVGMVSQDPEIPFPMVKTYVSSKAIPMNDLYEFIKDDSIPGMTIAKPDPPAVSSPPPGPSIQGTDPSAPKDSSAPHTDKATGQHRDILRAA